MAPEYGRRLLVNVIDERGTTAYPQPFALLPRSADPRDGFTELSYAILKKAVDTLAWHLDARIGKSATFQTFGWLSHPLDLRYQILTLAAMKLGWRAFFSSPRNSLKAHLSLLDEADCHMWLVDKAINPTVKDIAAQRDLKLVEIPSLEELLTAPNVAHYPYEKTFEEARLDPCLVLHTSGSTGLPKIVVCKHTLFTVMDAFHNLSQPGSQPFTWYHFQGMKAFMPFPAFHAAGLIISIGANVWFDVVNVLAPLRPLEAGLADSYHQYAGVDVSILPPSVLKDIAGNSEYLEHLKGLKYVGNCGGPSSREVGLALQKYSHPFNCIGLTEASTLPTVLLEPDDYLYMRYSPCAGMHFKQVSDEYYELVFTKDIALEDYQNVFSTFEDLDEWSSKDLYRKHPTKPDLWMHCGRADDIIVFSNGEKLNPVTIEQEVSAHPRVAGATMFGSGRFEAGLLVQPQEPVADPHDREILLEGVWKIAEAINKVTVMHGRISKDMILFAKADKPFPRSSKGSIQRRLLLELYAEEIEETYRAKKATEAAEYSALSTDDLEELIEALQGWIEEHTGRSAPRPEDDLFGDGVGIDSLVVLRIVNAINNAANGRSITPRTIYAHPTISALAQRIVSSANRENEMSDTSMSRSQRMDDMLQRFSRGLEPRPPGFVVPKSQRLVVAVTGTTSTLGSYLLDSLVHDQQVAKICCLNRRENAMTAQKELQASHGLYTDFEKVEFMRIDVSKERLGLSPEQQRTLLEEVSLIIHNAWQVDFNIPMASFADTHIYGVRQLIDICNESKHRAMLFFISSMSTVQAWKPECSVITGEPLVPETDHDWSTSAEMGYAESKHVSERLLVEAARALQLPISVCRVGQIAGPVRRGQDYGEWPRQEWLPSLIRTSITMEMLPSDLGALDEIDWIPVDTLGDVVAELAMGACEIIDTFDAAAFFAHAINPLPTRWAALLPVLLQHVPNAKTVPFSDWVGKLKAYTQAEMLSKSTGRDQYKDIPAAKLLSFFEAQVLQAPQALSHRKARLDTHNARLLSQTLGKMLPVNADWMKLWMQQWKVHDSSFY